MPETYSEPRHALCRTGTNTDSTGPFFFEINLQSRVYYTRMRKMRRLQHISTIPILAALLLTPTASPRFRQIDAAVSQVDTAADASDIVESFRNRHMGS